MQNPCGRPVTFFILSCSVILPHLVAVKQKGDALECGNYRGIKLLEIALKVYERVIERRIRERVHINSNQFGFMPGRGTIDPIFILRQVQEKILEGNRKRYWTFVDLEKAFDRVPREVLYWSLRRRRISEKLVRVIRSIGLYDGAVTKVRSGRGKTLAFEIKVGGTPGILSQPIAVYYCHGCRQRICST